MGLHLGLAKGHEMKATFTLWLQRIQVTFSRLILATEATRLISLYLPSGTSCESAPTTACIFSGNKTSNFNIRKILMGFHLHGLNPVRLWHKAAKRHSQGCLWERRNNVPPSTQNLPPARASWRQPVGGNCVPQQGWWKPSGVPHLPLSWPTQESNFQFSPMWGLTLQW